MQFSHPLHLTFLFFLLLKLILRSINVNRISNLVSQICDVINMLAIFFGSPTILFKIQLYFDFNRICICKFCRIKTDAIRIRFNHKLSGVFAKKI